MDQKNKLKVAVLGVGWVGGAVARHFQDTGRQPVLYDPPKGLGSRDELAKADIHFVCLPTPFDPAKGGFDLSYVEGGLKVIPRGKVVVIKSTVLPGSTESLQSRFPDHRLLFNPEFLREKTADQDFRHPDRQIVGYTEQSRGDAEAVMELLPAAPFSRIIKATEAEMIKYFGNAFLALKVVFANQVFDLCRKMDISYDEVRECAAADPRIGPSHLQVLCDGYRGYAGSCFPKDVRAFIQLGENVGIDLALMKTCEGINNSLIGATKK
jgi:nucleotide sugar dehydrogenase